MVSAQSGRISRDGDAPVTIRTELQRGSYDDGARGGGPLPIPGPPTVRVRGGAPDRIAPARAARKGSTPPLGDTHSSSSDHAEAETVSARARRAEFFPTDFAVMDRRSPYN